MNLQEITRLNHYITVLEEMNILRRTVQYELPNNKDLMTRIDTILGSVVATLTPYEAGLVLNFKDKIQRTVSLSNIIENQVNDIFGKTEL